MLILVPERWISRRSGKQGFDDDGQTGSPELCYELEEEMNSRGTEEGDRDFLYDASNPEIMLALPSERLLRVHT